MPIHHDYVDFMEYNFQNKKHEQVCRVYLVDGKLTYEGKKADDIKDMVAKSKRLKLYADMGAYPLLAQMAHAFKGSYFYATTVRHASVI